MLLYIESFGIFERPSVGRARAAGRRGDGCHLWAVNREVVFTAQHESANRPFSAWRGSTSQGGTYYPRSSTCCLHCWNSLKTSFDQYLPVNFEGE